MNPADITLLHVLGKPTIAPDGGHAVVAMTRPELDSDEYRAHLWIVPTDGSGAGRAFWRAAGGEGQGARPQLYVMPTGGGEPRRLTDHPLGAGAPVWSPDSRRIAYSARVPDEGRYTSGPAE